MTKNELTRSITFARRKESLNLGVINFQAAPSATIEIRDKPKKAIDKKTLFIQLL
jgi:hypothetical protein